MGCNDACVTLPDGERVAKLGQGTWEMGERRSMIDMRFKPPGSKRTLETL